MRMRRINNQGTKTQRSLRRAEGEQGRIEDEDEDEEDE